MIEKKIRLSKASDAIKDGSIGSQFSGEPYYDSDSDSIFHFRKETAFKAVRVDGFMTIFRSRKTNQVVGIQLKNVSSIVASIQKRTGSQITSKSKLELLVNEVVQQEYMDWGAQIAPNIYYTLQVDGFYLSFVPRGLFEKSAA
ncbi:MAG: hypothetical protein V3V10_03290 [Planctomycetota bacterium]